MTQPGEKTMADQTLPSKTEFLRRMQAGWEELNGYLKTLSEEDLTVSTDEVGWSVKDHLLHLAMWEGAMCGLLDEQPRWESMGVDRGTWNSGDYDVINAAIRQQHQAMSLAEVLGAFADAHRRLVAKIESLTDADLLKPYRAYQPDSTSENPVIGSLIGNSYDHYTEHQPWIEAIVANRKR
jgi:hypothetical protein